MREKHEPTVGNYQRGLEVMARPWGREVANDTQMFWRSAHPDIERYITAFALGDVWARPTLDLKTCSLICLACWSAATRSASTHAGRFQMGPRRLRVAAIDGTRRTVL